MKRYEVWNGETPINKYSAEDVLKDREDIRVNLGDVFLVIDEYDIVCEIQFGRFIKSKYKMPIDYTLEQVAKEYVDNMNIGGEGSMPLGNMNLIKEQADKIDILEAEKEALKKVTKEQDDLLVDNAFKIAEIQMKLGGM